MASRQDLSRMSSRDFSVSTTVAFIQKKADDTILRVQQALGRTPSSKGQYATVHYGETFNKKHIRMLSVVLFLMCVSSVAIYGGFYYTFQWKPCTKKFRVETTDTSTCAKDAHDLWADEKNKYKWAKKDVIVKCEKNSTEPSKTRPNITGSNRTIVT